MAKVREKTPNKDSRAKKLIVAVLMAVWVGAAVIASQLIVGSLMIFLLSPEEFAKPAWTAIYSALSYILALILIVFLPPILYEKWKKGKTKVKVISRKDIGLSNLPTWTDIGLAPAGFIAYFLLAAIVTGIFSLFPWFNAEEVQDVGFSVYASGIDKLIAFVVLVVVAPIAEEIIFRGFLYDRLRRKFLGAYSNAVSIVLSSLLVSLVFGIVHLQWNVGVNVFAMSIVLCAMREITGTIYAGILMHMLKNGVAFYLLYILGVS